MHWSDHRSSKLGSKALASARGIRSEVRQATTEKAEISLDYEAFEQVVSQMRAAEGNCIRPVISFCGGCGAIVLSIRF